MKVNLLVSESKLVSYTACQLFHNFKRNAFFEICNQYNYFSLEQLSIILTLSKKSILTQIKVLLGLAFLKNREVTHELVKKHFFL